MKTNKSKNIKKSKVGNRKAGSRNQMISHPPPISSFNVVHSTRLRFVLSSAFAGEITFQNLLDTILFAATSTALYDLFYVVKIRQIELWSLPSIGSSNSVSLTFDATASGFVGNQVTHTDTSMGIEPAHLRVSPAKKSQASMFQASSGTSAFTLNVPSGAVVDVSLSFKGSTEANTVLADNAGITLTTGAIYYRGLDGADAASTFFKIPAGIAQA